MCHRFWFCDVNKVFCTGITCGYYVKHDDKKYYNRFCLYNRAIDEEYPDGCKICPERFVCWTERWHDENKTT